MVSMTGKVCLVTGANSGIGKATTFGLAARGATVIMVCRSERKGRIAQLQLVEATANDSIYLELADLSSMESVRLLAERCLTTLPRIDVLIHNAGVLRPRREESVDGIEVSFATNVLAGFVLTQALEPLLKRSAPSQVLHVTSGGMYTQKLETKDLFSEKQPYNGVRTYAQTKRAQVILNELWATRFGTCGVSSACMHPGWAATPGVATSLPRFNRLFQKVLRDSDQGADTLLWLATQGPAMSQNGRFFFDRAPRRTHLFPWTQCSPEERATLWDTCQKLSEQWA